MGNKKHTTESIVRTIKAYYQKYNKSPTSRTHRKIRGFPSNDAIKRNGFASWDEILECAGVPHGIEYRNGHYDCLRKHNRETIIQNIKQYYKTYGRAPTSRTFGNEHGFPDAGAVRRCGFKSWNDAIACADISINRKSNGGTVKVKCAYCGRTFSVVCSRIKPNKKNYCCQKHEFLSNRHPMSRNQIIEIILDIERKLKRVPVIAEVKKDGRFKATYGVIKRHFGTWNDMIVAAGLKPYKSIFGIDCMSRDGHKCKSYKEKEIDEWLCDNHIVHDKDVKYPYDAMMNNFGGNNNCSKSLTCDWVINDVWFEYCGLMHLGRYRKRINRKIRLANKYNIKLVLIGEKNWKAKVKEVSA
jgi:hypothetical protein